jgi:hypothetical protein
MVLVYTELENNMNYRVYQHQQLHCSIYYVPCIILRNLPLDVAPKRVGAFE